MAAVMILGSESVVGARDAGDGAGGDPGHRARPAAAPWSRGVSAIAGFAGHPGRKVAASAAADSGYVITSEVVVRNCGACHARDATGRMGRLSYLRKTPEGWQNSIRRMVSLHGVQVEPEAAREIVRYLSNAQGLAPEELAPGAFEVERRMTPFRYADQETERTCGACHSMGRVITVRRTPEEWSLLIATHRYLYPLIDRQIFYRTGGPGADADAPEPRSNAVDRAVEHLSEAFPLETPEWQSWSANLRPPRLEGRWALRGHEPGKGPVFGTVEIRPVSGRPDQFTTSVNLRYAADGSTATRAGSSVVYTGFQWRGRSQGRGADDQLREVMSVARGWGEMTGRWFTGAHDEFGMDVTLRRLSGEPTITGVYPRAIRSGGGPQEVRVYGANLPRGLAPSAIDLGPGVQVRAVSSSSPDVVVLRVEASPDARNGGRDVFIGGAALTGALVVYDRVDRIRVTPEIGLARVGGAVVPKQFQQFEAIAYQNGADEEPGTPDDLELGTVPVQWSLEEYPVTYDDDDLAFVGQIDASGLFTPSLDGPNPERSRNRNNIGEVWVVATYEEPGAAGRRVQERSYLIVTAPLHLRWADPQSP